VKVKIFRMSVAIVPVKLTCASRTEEVVAVFTTACGISSMSERLAEKLGIVLGEAARIRNAGTRYFGHLPDRVTYVECSIHRTSVGNDVVSVPVAFLIMPNPYNELVLAVDWSTELYQQEPHMITYLYNGPTREPNLTYMHILGGVPTRGPGYSAEFACSFGHIIDIGRADKQALKQLVCDEKQRNSEVVLSTR